MAKQAQTLTRDAIQYKTTCDFSTSQHSKQNKHFLATATAPKIMRQVNTLTSCFKLPLIDCFYQRLFLYMVFLLTLEHTFLFITTNGQVSTDTDKRRDTVRECTTASYKTQTKQIKMMMRTETLDNKSKKHRGCASGLLTLIETKTNNKETSLFK